MNAKKGLGTVASVSRNNTGTVHVFKTAPQQPSGQLPQILGIDLHLTPGAKTGDVVAFQFQTAVEGADPSSASLESTDVGEKAYGITDISGNEVKVLVSGSTGLKKGSTISIVQKGFGASPGFSARKVRFSNWGGSAGYLVLAFGDKCCQGELKLAIQSQSTLSQK